MMREADPDGEDGQRELTLDKFEGLVAQVQPCCINSVFDYVDQRVRCAGRGAPSRCPCPICADATSLSLSVTVDPGFLSFDDVKTTFALLGYDLTDPAVR